MKIRLSTKDWLWNAGIVGFYNILKNSNEDIKIENEEIVFDSISLENFEYKFFDYFSKKYEKFLFIPKKNDFLILKELKEKDDFEEKDYLELNRIILRFNLLNRIKKKFYLKEGNDREKAIELLNILVSETNSFKNKNYFNNDLEIKKIKKIIDIQIKLFNIIEKNKKYYLSKASAYEIINNCWNGISFFIPNKRKNDIFEEYKNLFLDPAVDYINKLEKSSEKMNFFCDLTDLKTNNSKISLNFLNGIGYDIDRKTSNSWNHNFQSTIIISKLAFLIYSCVPAGFSYSIRKGIFVNANFDLEELIRINNKILFEILNINKEEFSFQEILNNITNAIHDLRYEYNDIQVIRSESIINPQQKHPKEYITKYSFYLVEKNVLNLILKNKEKLEKLKRIYYRKNEKGIQVYDEIMENLFYKNGLKKILFHYLKIVFENINSNKKNSNLSAYILMIILEINQNYINVMKGKRMNDNENKEIYYIRRQGIEFRKKYISITKNENKINTILYKLIETLRSGNKKNFLNILMTSYMYLNMPFDSNLVQILKDEEKFETFAYAFVIGMFGEKEKMEGEKNENE